MDNLLDESIIWTFESAVHGDESYERLNGKIFSLKMDFDHWGHRIILFENPITNSIVLESSRVISIYRNDPSIHIKTAVTEFDMIRLDSLLPTSPTNSKDIIPYDNYEIKFK